MKKIYAIVLAIAVVLVFIPVVVLADGWTEVGDEQSLKDSIAVGENIKLTADIELEDSLEISGKTLTIDLNGYRLSTKDAAGTIDPYAAAAPVLRISGSGHITIKGGGTVQSGATINSNRGAMEAHSTIWISDTAALTVEDGAEIKGGDAVNSKKAGHAIWYWSSGNLVLNSVMVMGGDNIKDFNEETGSCDSDGTAGDALNFFNSAAAVTITGSDIRGGDGLNRGYPETRVGDGINQAAGGMAISSLNSTYTCQITDSHIRGGNSDIYNAGTAIDAGKGKFVIEDSTIEGGDSFATAGEGYGIGGTAINIGDANGDVSITSSAVTGGSGGDSWIGCGIEYKKPGATLSIANSIISGGGVTGAGAGFGNALYFGVAPAAFTNVSLHNTLFKLGADPDDVESACAMYLLGGGLEQLLDGITGGDYVFGPEGSLLLGSPPDHSQTTIKAKADVTFMVVITPSVDFGTIDRGMALQSRDFVVAVEDALIEAGSAIKVENVTTDMKMRDRDGAGNKTLAFTLAQTDGVFNFPQSGLTNGGASIDSSVSCLPSELEAAGSYKGYMTFEVSYIGP